MEVKDTSEFATSLIPAGRGTRLRWKLLCMSMVRLTRGDQIWFTHEVARKAAIILRTSVSLRVVSSNPGVSIKTTRRPSRSKAPATCTVFVQDRRPLLTPRLDPLTRLMNCANRSQAKHRYIKTRERWGTHGGFSGSRRSHDAIRFKELMGYCELMRIEGGGEHMRHQEWKQGEGVQRTRWLPLGGPHPV